MRVNISAVVAAFLLASQAAAQADKPLSCSAGPITKGFGGTSWLVRSCDDIAIHLLSAPGNPAFPFYFLVYPSETERGRFVIEGEGTGDKQASAAALADISRLSEADIEALISETKQQKK